LCKKQVIGQRTGGKCVLQQVLAATRGIGQELGLFAATIILVGGVSDIAIDLIWGLRALWRRITIYSVHPRADAATLASPEAPGRLAIFVPAWREANVIGPMLHHALAAIGDRDCRIYVGTYPNDPATGDAVRALGSPKVRLVIGPRDGPTTKADNLNVMWRALCVDENQDSVRFKAIVLHDAEDMVHPNECALFDSLIERFALVQIPVVPLPHPKSRWVGGHYLDEFADHHLKTIVAREAIGAGLPSAGVGCAFARDMLDRVAEIRGGAPFDADSLTEDYELGLRIGQLGGRAAFVRLPERPDGPAIAVHAHFPGTIEAAVRQKSRWIAGIALAGWDRLGWHGGLAERWMRLDDRRSVLAALVLLAAYVAFFLLLVTSMLGWATQTEVSPPSRLLLMMMSVCSGILIWRLLLRAVLVTHLYGWREGCRSIPRIIVANFIAILAAWRAVGLYIRLRRDGVVRWDKTSHIFPAVDAPR
jgi:adsorption protein B